MEYRFNSQEWRILSPEARAKRCGLMAQEAKHLAADAHAEAKLIYLELADQWVKLQAEMIRHINATKALV